MQCRLCNGEQHVKHYYPDVQFNEKHYSYFKCSLCGTVNVFPDPDSEDFKKIYGENDHTYLADINEMQYDFNFPRFNHQGIQVSLIKKSKLNFENKSLLDFACGSGFYMKFTQELGAKVTGIEFSKPFAKLISEKSKMPVYSFDEFKKEFDGKTFDYIHMGHVLEHLVKPKETIDELAKFAHKETVFIFDGPLDKNRCISRWIIDLGSRIKNRKSKNFPPQHLSLSTAKSQKRFFKYCGFQFDQFFVREQYFPMPNQFNGNLKNRALYLMAFFSISVSSIIPSWGNVFHCRARLK